jgi:hypothetical protein
MTRPLGRNELAAHGAKRDPDADLLQAVREAKARQVVSWRRPCRGTKEDRAVAIAMLNLDPDRP